MICDYGCGQEANYKFRNGKYCCSKHFRQCPHQSKKYEKENNPMYGKKRYMSEKTRNKMSKSHIGLINVNKGKTWEEIYGKEKANLMKNQVSEKNSGENNGMYGKKRNFSVETKRRMSKGSRLTISKIKKQYPLFSKIEKMRYNPDKPGEKEIQVHCKNHNCKNSVGNGGWFTPTKFQISERIRQIEDPDGNYGSYFYCSDKCKNSCYLFNNRDHLRKESSKLPYTVTEYQQFREYVLERDNYKCQYCGKMAEVVHHERPKKLEPFFALDPDLAWSVCKKCHNKYGHKDECSTINIANKNCKNRKRMKGVQLNV